MPTLNSNRQAVVGLPDMTAWLIRNRAEAGDAVLCFDEYVPYFSQWFETCGYGSIDDRSEELERLTSAVEPLLDRTGLWVMCSPAGETGMAQGRWLEERGLWLADLRPKPRKSTALIGSAPIYSVGEPPDLEERWRWAGTHITPGPVKTLAETIYWLKTERGVEEFTPLPHERDKIRLDILLGTEPVPAGEDPWAKRDTDQTRLYEAPETLPPMDIRGFRISGGGGKPKRRAHSSSVDVQSWGEEDAVFFLDLVSGHGAAHCDVGTLFDEMALYRGVTQEDIRTRSVRFMCYVSAMETLGRWKS